MIELSSQISALTAAQPRNAALVESSQSFSALLLEQMLTTMRKTIHKENNPLYGGLSQDIFEGLLYQEYAQVLATSGNLGIDKLIYQQFD